MERSTEVDKVTGKPVVLFSKENKALIIDFGGTKRASLFPLNHPDKNNVSNKKIAFTSDIIRYEENNGRIVFIETQNTIYKEA